MSQLKEDLLAKKARLAELKRQRELRHEQHIKRQSLGEAPSPGRTTEDRKSEIDSFVSELLDRRRESGISPSRRESRPISFHGSHETPQDSDELSPRPGMISIATQTTTGTDNSTIVLEPALPQAAAPPKKEYITYTKAVQTDPQTDSSTSADEDDVRFRTRRRSSRKDQQSDQEIRASLRKEIEEELRSMQNGHANTDTAALQPSASLRTLSDNERHKFTESTDFQTFVERSLKVVERALDDEYDLLTDYTQTAALTTEEDETSYTRGSKKSHSLRETTQLFSDQYSRKRMISDIQFSSHFSGLVLTAYTKNLSAPNESPGQVLLWNVHAPSRPEHVFTCGSDVLSARFSPFHPNLVIGGCYSGQICLWDTRSPSSHPVQRTPRSGSYLGHTHPVFNMSIIGTPNAHNILTASTDGVVCSWSFDMLTQAQEYLTLHTPPPAKAEELAPTTMSFSSDPSFFLVGTEEGSIYPCHRYNQAGARAGVDTRLAYRGHTAPVTSTHFHPSRGPVNLGDILLSSSADWSLKLWHVKGAATSSAAAALQSTNTANLSGSQPNIVHPVLDIGKEDLVYDAKWSPYKPSVFACVTGLGELEVYDLLYDIGVPTVKATPTRGKNGVMPFKGLNKVCWDEKRGGFLATGGLDGVVTVFETPRHLQAASGEVDIDEWNGFKRLLGRLEGERY